MKTLEVLKKDARTGFREKGAKFPAPNQAADVWIGLGIVKDVNAPKKIAVKAKKEEVKKDK